MPHTPTLTYLGSASQYPSPKRALNSLFLTFQKEIWLFDCGESTQTQFLKTKSDPAEITKIFISHLHGDHCFGIMAMLLRIEVAKHASLCLESRARSVTIYGPVGMNEFILASLEGSSRDALSYEYKVVEFLPLDLQFQKAELLMTGQYSDNENLTKCCQDQIENVSSTISQFFNRDKSKIDNYCQENNILTFKDDEHHIDITDTFSQKTNENCGNSSKYKFLNCFIVPLIHTIPSFGYIFVFKNKTILLYGDCCNSDLTLKVLNDPSLIPDQSKNEILLVHESTLDDSLKEDAIKKGHSCPEIVATFVQKINLKNTPKFTLILNHFSQRYVDEDKVDENNTRQPRTSIMIEDARKILSNENLFDIHVAKDLWSLDI